MLPGTAWRPHWAAKPEYLDILGMNFYTTTNRSKRRHSLYVSPALSPLARNYRRILPPLCPAHFLRQPVSRRISSRLARLRSGGGSLRESPPASRSAAYVFTRSLITRAGLTIATVSTVFSIMRMIPAGVRSTSPWLANFNTSSLPSTAFFQRGGYARRSGRDLALGYFLATSRGVLPLHAQGLIFAGVPGVETPAPPPPGTFRPRSLPAVKFRTKSPHRCWRALPAPNKRLRG